MAIKFSREERFAVAFHSDGISFVGVEVKDGGKPRLARYRYFPQPLAAEPQEDFAQFLKRQKLKRSALSISFPASSYRLLLIDKPNIPDEEITAAIRWKVKDLVDLKSERLLVATLDNPEPPSNKDNPGQIFLVVAEEDKIEYFEKAVQQAKMSVRSIEIRELAQRNIAMLIPEEKEGIAFVTLDKDGGLITFSRGGDLFLSRRVDVATKEFIPAKTEEYVRRVASELQRSIDYFDRHYRAFTLKQIFILTPSFVDDINKGVVANNLSVACRWIHLIDLVDHELTFDEHDEGLFVQTVGAAISNA